MNAQEIAILVNFIDTVASRGAVRGEEMVTVGALRAKLVQIIEEAQKEAEATPEPQDTITLESDEE